VNLIHKQSKFQVQSAKLDLFPLRHAANQLQMNYSTVENKKKEKLISDPTFPIIF